MMSASSISVCSRPLRIFLVENHRDTSQYLAMFLQGLGHTVTSAGTLKEALSRISEEDFDVLISDIGLPDGNGCELLRRITQKVYAIAISGFGTASDIKASKEAGFRHHLVKPFGGDDLVPLLQEAASELAVNPA